MKADRLFTLVRRINSLLFLAGGVVVLFFLGIAAWDSLSRMLRTKPMPAPVRIAQTDEESSWHFGSFERLPGTDIIWAALRTEGDDYSKFSSGSVSETRNYLFFDLETRRSSWLLANNNALFGWSQEATTLERDGKAGRVVALVFHVALADSTGDGRITAADRHSLAVAAPDGSGFTALIDDVESVYDYEQFGENRGYIFYLSANVLRVAEIDLDNRVLLSDSGFSGAPSPSGT